jgi:hypothetical protein
LLTLKSALLQTRNIRKKNTEILGCAQLAALQYFACPLRSVNGGSSGGNLVI